jgi:hypothetical protein
MEINRICRMCLAYKPISEFHKSKKGVRGYDSRCRGCKSDSKKAKFDCIVDEPGETWKDVVGYEGLYMVSSMGRVKSLAKTVFILQNGGNVSLQERLRAQHHNNKNKKIAYLIITLTNPNRGKRSKTEKVHQIVAKAFVPNPENKECVNHKNGNKLDNRAENLEWVTRKENAQHAFKNGLSGGVVIRPLFKKLTLKDVTQIFKSNESGTMLAKKYDVSKGIISAIRTGKIWNRVTGLLSTGKR